MKFEKAPDIQTSVCRLIQSLSLHHIKIEQIFCLRSYESKARAYARIWGLPRVFQIAAGFKPAYVLEVLSKYYDRLNHEEKTKVLIHELLHIPKTFSGALLSHRGRFHTINKRKVEVFYKRLLLANKKV